MVKVKMNKDVGAYKSTHSDKDKKEMLQEHFLYEFEMLIVSLEIFNSSFSKEVLNLKKDSIALEVSLLHARNLLEFFYYKSKDSKRPYAQDFMKCGVIWGDIAPKKTEVIAKLEKQVNEDISHLSWARIGKQTEEKRWDILKLFQDFLKVVRVFLSNVEDDYLDARLKRI